MLALELGSNLMSYHAELVSKAQYADVIGALLDSQSAWDVFHVANVDAASRTAKALLEVAAKLDAPLQVIPSDRSPYLPIAETWEQFIAGKGKKFRYKLRRRSDDIERDGGCELRWFGPNDDMERLLHDVLAIETRSWKAGSGLAIGSRELELTYHRLLLPYLQHGRMLVANVLYRQGQPIAYSLCCECRGWMGHLKTSFDQDYERLSPGGFVIDACVRRAFESGAREFDFLGAAAPHKLAWTSFVRAHNNYYLFAPRLVPKLIGRAKLYWSRRRRHPPTDTPSVNPLSD